MGKINKAQVNIMLIGCGSHARRIYIPSILKISKTKPVSIRVVVDVESEKKKIAEYLSFHGACAETLFIEDSNSVHGNIPNYLKDNLTKRIKELEINAVIISTDPKYHKAYADWALDNNLNILMDKPITTRMGAVGDIEQAKGIYLDYKDLLSKYQHIQDKGETIFSIMVQRRYEVGFLKVNSLIQEVAENFNMPVTSIQSMHADGVWVFPDEIVEQKNHSYSTGSGKCSHSGYHIFDAVWQMYTAGRCLGKIPDFAETTTSFIQPSGLLRQYSQEDYRALFGKEYDDRPRRSMEELYNIFSDYGENDSFSLVRLLSGDENICNISINLLHNSFSRRKSVLPAQDLYKSNGRVKHQYYHVQQGPFQCIQVHNYQSNDKQEKSNISDYDIGGNNHFDIYVFRNADFFSNDVPPLEVIKLNDLDSVGKFDHSRLYNETAKDGVIHEFVDFVLGRISRKELRSNIDSHSFPVRLMSAIYESHVRQVKALSDSWVRFPIAPELES